MRNSSTPRDAAPKAWTRPELVRLGKIADVAGASNTTGQVISMVNTKS